MNKARRAKINSICEKLAGLQEELTTVTEEEQDAYDNMPEGIQEGEKGEAAQEALDGLEAAYDEIQSVIDNLELVVAA